MGLFIDGSLAFLSPSTETNCIGGVMVNVLALSAIDRGFKDYQIGICCFSEKNERTKIS